MKKGTIPFFILLFQPKFPEGEYEKILIGVNRGIIRSYLRDIG
jgi:hypothetical protein